MAETGEDLLNVTQVHTRTGVSRSAIYQAINENRLPSETIGGHVFVRASDVDKWEPLTPDKRKGLSIGGRRRKEVEAPQPIKRGPGRPPKAQEASA